MRPNGAKITERARNKLTRWSPSFTHADLINLQTIPSERKTRPRYLTNFKIDAITNLHLQHSKLHGGSSEYITVFYHSECCIIQCVSFFFFGQMKHSPIKHPNMIHRSPRMSSVSYGFSPVYISYVT